MRTALLVRVRRKAERNVKFTALGDPLRKRLILEYRDGRRSSAQAPLLPSRHHVVVGLLRQFGALGEGLDVAIIHAGIDQAFRTPGPDLRRVQAGIEIGAPGLAP